MADAIDVTSHPLLTPRDTVKKVLILTISSDRGLCGGFNNNLNKFVHNWVRENRETYDVIDLSFCGRRGNSYFTGKESVREYYEGVVATPQFHDAEKIGEEFSSYFVDGRI